jgi:putative spermidine/putrescine transport system ATP-binding protein
VSDLSLRHVTKDFGGVTAVDEVSLDFPPGQLTALLGPSGCGKTTLLRMIAGLEEPSRGTLRLDGADITALPAHERRFGMVFQSFALFPHLSVAENVVYSLAIRKVAKSERRARARELLELVQLPQMADRRVGELSGGQRQRVAIARALAQEPRVFLLDEPMSALDAKLREEMQVELRMLQQRLGITTIVVTHDQREAMTMADRIVVMSDGRPEQVGTPREIYHHPATAFVAGFIGKANMLEGTARGGAIETAGARLAADPPAPFLDGSPVTVACRPEWMRLAHAGEGAAGGANALAARVTFVRDIGQVREIHLAAGPSGEHALVAELPFADPTPYAVGDAVVAELPPAALRVFPAAPGATARREAA